MASAQSTSSPVAGVTYRLDLNQSGMVEIRNHYDGTRQASKWQAGPSSFKWAPNTPVLKKGQHLFASKDGNGLWHACGSTGTKQLSYEARTRDNPGPASKRSVEQEFGLWSAFPRGGAGKS